MTRAERRDRRQRIIRKRWGKRKRENYGWSSAWLNGFPRSAPLRALDDRYLQPSRFSKVNGAHGRCLCWMPDVDLDRRVLRFLWLEAISELD